MLDASSKWEHIYFGLCCTSSPVPLTPHWLVGYSLLKYSVAEEIAWRVTVGELYLAGVFIEREIWSTLQRNLLPVKWRPCFSAEIWRIFLQTVIPNDWYYGLPFLFCCSAWLQCVRDKKKAHIICHCVAGVLTGNERPNKIRFSVSRDCFGSVLKNEGYQGSLFLLHWPCLTKFIAASRSICRGEGHC